MIGVYARALVQQLPLVGASGEALPDTELVDEDAAVERDALRAYAEVCGFRVIDAAPPTYLHVLAFPLAMRLMTAGDFPFGVIGLVHIANRIEQDRAARAGERLTLRVRAENLADHDRGRRFDVVSEARDGEGAIWRESSTYLRREPPSGGTAASGRRPPRDAGSSAARPAGAVWSIPGDAGRRYAAVSGDRNPIHLHPLAARLFGRPRPIAHGMWLKARCLAALEGRVPEACAIDVRFKTPVALGSRVAFTSGERDGGRDLALHSPRDGRPHLIGRLAPR
jgi:acyl dehydratase